MAYIKTSFHPFCSLEIFLLGWNNIIKYNIIIENNPEFFDFICEKNNQKDKISSNELYTYLLKGYQKPPRINCGSRKENSIYLIHPYFLD